jgi:GNAT superfamily N-acetyltransferase
MPFIVAPVEEKDGVEWCQIHYDAFHPLLGFLWKSVPTEQSVKNMAKQRVATLSDPNTEVMKVVDTESGKIAGIAIWKIYPEERTLEDLEKSALEGPYQPDVYVEARKAFMKNIYDTRINVLGTQPCVVLGALVVRPEFQRRGVGHLLMDYGTKRADE